MSSRLFLAQMQALCFDVCNWPKIRVDIHRRIERSRCTLYDLIIPRIHDGMSEVRRRTYPR